MREKLIVAFPAYESIIKGLSEKDLKALDSTVDIEVDHLIHLDSEGFSVNHGSVGSKDIRYDFEHTTHWYISEKCW